jgi:enamine deaminase RidA (YjgF/YER057c/UK114 family)
MAGAIDARLQELGIELPEAAAPAANYVPYVVSGNQVFVAGQITIHNGEIQYVGKLGRDYGVEEGEAAARLCALNIIAQVKAACDGDLDRVVRCVRLGGFVNSTADFTDQPEVVNGASNLMVEVFGDKGKHSRAAVSAASLPRGVAVEVDAVFEID